MRIIKKNYTNKCTVHNTRYKLKTERLHKKIKMKRYFLIIIFSVALTNLNAQIIFKSGEDITSADLRIRVGEDVTSADIRIRIGEDVTSSDFTVGITNQKNKADFIVTNSNNYDLRIRAGADVTSADIRIRAGADVTSADIRIKIKSSGSADYLVYIDREIPKLEDVVVGLLPVINKYLNYKFETIPKIK